VEAGHDSRRELRPDHQGGAATLPPRDPDGMIGPVTVKALQAHVGATQDGEWGRLTTEAMQRALNAGRF
jgi:hypothetical protein